MKRAVGFAWLASLALAFTTVPSRAQTQDDWDGDFDAKPAARRSDVTFGGRLGGVLGAASGFPNEVSKIDDPRFEVSTGAAVGVAYELWLGGALADWLSFGLGYGATSFEGSGPKAELTHFILRVEAFPLFYASDFGRDFGVFTELGLGSGAIVQRGKDIGEGGAPSIVGIGAFWEPLRFGRFNAGPEVEYVHSFSQTMTSNAGIVGLRIAYYGGPSPPPEAPAAPAPRAPWPPPPRAPAPPSAAAPAPALSVAR